MEVGGTKILWGSQWLSQWLSQSGNLGPRPAGPYSGHSLGRQKSRQLRSPKDIINPKIFIFWEKKEFLSTKYICKKLDLVRKSDQQAEVVESGSGKKPKFDPEKDSHKRNMVIDPSDM